MCPFTTLSTCGMAINAYSFLLAAAAGFLERIGAIWLRTPNQIFIQRNPKVFLEFDVFINC